VCGFGPDLPKGVRAELFVGQESPLHQAILPA